MESGHDDQPCCSEAINNLGDPTCLAAGIPDAAGYTAHGLRSGFVTEAKTRAVDEADIMKHTRHRSLAQMRLYDPTSSWWNRNATGSNGL